MSEQLTNLFVIFFATIFINNIVLTYFLGICPFVAVSKEISTALGMGMAVIFVMFMTMAINWPLYHLILIPFKVEYLHFLVFIFVIATFVQIVEIFIDRYSPVLYISKLRFSKVPKGLEGPGITMIIAGIMALAFMGFAGVINL